MKIFSMILLLVATSAYGEIYKWTDSNGTAHFTNSTYEIPEKYRARAITVNLGIPEQKTDQPPSAQLPVMPVTPQPSSPSVPPSAQQQPAAAVTKTEESRPKKVIRTKKSFSPPASASEQ